MEGVRQKGKEIQFCFITLHFLPLFILFYFYNFLFENHKQFFDF